MLHPGWARIKEVHNCDTGKQEPKEKGTLTVIDNRAVIEQSLLPRGDSQPLMKKQLHFRHVILHRNPVNLFITSDIDISAPTAKPKHEVDGSLL